jgi:protein-L-isoaspartate(D-aspartate) O-methyltransferase
MRSLGLASLLPYLALACVPGEAGPDPSEPDDETAALRAAMVSTQIEARGVNAPNVLEALRRVPRHRFVPADMLPYAHDDRPLPIGYEQTISQPYIVALMTELVTPDPDTRVLEIGTGSGYQAAVLAECAASVHTIEIVPELGERSRALLADLGYDNVHVRVGDGFDGWPEEAPFDAIVVTAAPSRIPQPLLDQLAVGGKLVIPVGATRQDLVVVTRTAEGYSRRTVTPVRFVPMTGKALETP